MARKLNKTVQTWYYRTVDCYRRRASVTLFRRDRNGVIVAVGKVKTTDVQVSEAEYKSNASYKFEIIEGVENAL